MICPNCGAILERHSFADICQYCGYISANDVADKLSGEGKLEKDALECYEYIQRNVLYISSHPKFVSIKQNVASFEIQCTKAFHPLDAQYQIIQGIELVWKAIIDKESIRLVLLAKGVKSISGNIIISLDGMINLVLRETKSNTLYDEYIVSDNDFKAICNSTSITFALDENKYDEFRIYSHRFFNFVFNRTKYVYAINQHLLTD